ncbi:MAG: hypothetical protein Q7T56_11640 [Nocardioidaceae bacterium]|nr:hypothetical protein [Nocardioidaceae bacterium]
MGPHKTGTTALQSAFHAGRVALARQGVHYLGGGLQPAAAVTALRGSRALRGDTPASRSTWDALVREAAAAGRRRVVLSSEFLADLGPDEIRGVVDDLGRDDVHVLVTLRPLWRIAPSQWQQYVQNAHVTSWPSWLEQMLDRPPYDKPSPSFWRRHRHDRLVARWVAEVGADRVVVVAVDDHDRQMLPRSVESLLALSPGTLRPHVDRHNRGLTRPEIEVVRHLNKIARREQWSEGDYAHYVRRAVTRTVKHRPADPEDLRLHAPDRAVERLLATGREMVTSIRASGVRVVGDLDQLLRPPAGPADHVGGVRTWLGLPTAADAVVAAAEATSAGPVARRPVTDVGVPRLLATLVARTGSRLRLRARLALARRSAR